MHLFLANILAAVFVAYLSVAWFSAVAGVMVAGTAKARRRALLTALIWPWFAIRYFFVDGRKTTRKKGA